MGGARVGALHVAPRSASSPLAAFGVSLSRVSAPQTGRTGGRMTVYASGTEREAAGAVMPPPAARSVDEQHDGARDKRKRDKAQDGKGGKSEDGALNGLGITAAGLERSRRTGFCRGRSRRNFDAAGWGKPRPPKPAPK